MSGATMQQATRDDSIGFFMQILYTIRHGQNIQKYQQMNFFLPLA